MVRTMMDYVTAGGDSYLKGCIMMGHSSIIGCLCGGGGGGASLNGKDTAYHLYIRFIHSHS